MRRRQQLGERVTGVVSDTMERAGRMRVGRRTGRQTGTGYFWAAGPLLLAGLAAAGGLLLSGRGMMFGLGGRRLEDVMVKDLTTIDAGATIMDAAQRMRDANVGVLPVVEGGRLRGVLTDRDIVIRAVSRGVNPSSARVSECLSENLVTGQPDWSVDEAMRVMSARQIGRLPVVDGSGRLVGMVTLSSLALRGRDQDEALETAQEVSRRSARIA